MKIPKTIELYALSGWIVEYMNYMSIKLLKVYSNNMKNLCVIDIILFVFYHC